MFTMQAIGVAPQGEAPPFTVKKGKATNALAYRIQVFFPALKYFIAAAKEIFLQKDKS
jgi:hypothetical protein